MERPREIGVLRDPRTRRLWAQAIVGFPRWRELGSEIDPQFHIDVIMEMLGEGADDVTVCAKLLEVLETNNFDWTEYRYALIGLGMGQLASRFWGEVQLYTPVQDREHHHTTQCLFLLFTPQVDAAAFVQRMTDLTYQVSGRIPVLNNGQPVMTFTRLLSRNVPMSPVAIVVAQIYTNDFTDLRYITEMIGKIPNLVVVHKENAPEIGGSQFYLINSSIQDVPLQALNHVCNHSWCPSAVNCYLSSSLSHNFQMKFLCDYLKNLAVDRAGILLHDDAAEAHLPCLINRLVVSPSQILQNNNWAFVSLKFDNEERELHNNFIFRKQFPFHVKFVIGNVCEVIVQVGIDTAWDIIFNPQFYAEALELLNLDVTQVKALNLALLHDLIHLAPEHLKQDLLAVAAFLTVQEEQENLPLPVVIDPIRPHEPPLPPPPPPLLLPPPPVQIWAACGRNVWGKHLAMGNHHDFLDSLRKPKFLLQNNSVVLPDRTVFWFAIESLEQVTLSKGNTQKLIELILVEPNHQIFKFTFHPGQYILQIGASLYMICVYKNKNNRRL